MTEKELKKFLDKPGLTYFWSKIKSYIDEEDAHRAYRHESLVANSPNVEGWMVGNCKPGDSVSALVNLHAGDDDLMMNIEVTPGNIMATVQSGHLDGHQIYVGESPSGKLYVYTDGDPLPSDATVTVLEVSDPSKSLIDPQPLAPGLIPSMARKAAADWGYGERIQFLLSLIPDEASPINKLVDRAFLETQLHFEKSQREATDIQLAAKIELLKQDQHKHNNKDYIDNYGAAGSATVPVYIAGDGTPTACTNDFMHADDLERERDERIASDIAIQGDISDINSKIPTEASVSNKLVPKSYVDDLGNRLEAHYLGCDEHGSPFPTYQALFPKDGTTPKFFYQGIETTPNTNDVVVVTDDSEHTSSIDPDNHATTRYRYDGKQWVFEYIINNNALNQEQLLAINSGITQWSNEAYATHVNDASLKKPTHHLGSGERELWNAKVEKDQLDAEQTAREAGDKNLQGNLDAEEAIRKANDEELDSKLAAAVADLTDKINKVDAKGLFVNGMRLRFGHRSDTGH